MSAFQIHYDSKKWKLLQIVIFKFMHNCIIIQGMFHENQEKTNDQAEKFQNVSLSRSVNDSIYLIKVGKKLKYNIIKDRFRNIAYSRPTES